MQPAEVGANICTSKSPLRKILDIQNTDKLPVLVALELNVKDQVDGKYCNFQYSKTSSSLS